MGNELMLFEVSNDIIKNDDLELSTLIIQH